MTEISPDETARKEELHRAAEARAILDHPMFKDAVTALREGLLGEIEKSSVSEVDRVRDAQRCLKLLTKMISVIENHIKTGTMATAQLLEMRERKRLTMPWR